MFRALSITDWLGGGNKAQHAASEERQLLTPGVEDLEAPHGGVSEGAGAVPEQAKGMGSYLRDVATSATKKVSNTMRETAQTIKKSVEEHKIDNLLDMTIIGNFKKEQEKFVKEKKLKKSDSALPPWAGYNDEETVRQQILSLSAERRNFIRDPPAGVQFNFDFDTIAPVAIVMLQEDELLSKMRFELVPKLVKEDQFWRNYFYRVSLIKQSAQLSSLAVRQAENSKEKLEHHLRKSIAVTDSTLSKTPPVPMKKQNESAEVHTLDKISTSPVANEFVSDAYDTSSLNQEDLLRGMEQLGMRGDQTASVEADDIPDWEKELQRELQEFEIVDVKANVSDAWEKEIEEMLQEDD
ncbi:synapse-associated protein 1-like isoform X2 [Scyliorhinus canicula]|uniref:synapse-associated protein 1-like isoform X2 n=1 Tax=Scyliorhinus canicula TaxID=7830 RepID=UPI0018F4A150|nr:synapse-associated protein 1-like isoform X2 [Scyliorhinus canicula]